MKVSTRTWGREGPEDMPSWHLLQHPHKALSGCPLFCGLRAQTSIRVYLSQHSGRYSKPSKDWQGPGQAAPKRKVGRRFPLPSGLGPPTQVPEPHPISDVPITLSFNNYLLSTYCIPLSPRLHNGATTENQPTKPEAASPVCCAV